MISAFTPENGEVGSTVTINGTGFSNVSTNNVVYFGGVRAVVSAASATSLQVIVPKGSQRSPITVTVNGLTAYAAKPFNVIFNVPETLGSLSFADPMDSTVGFYPYGVVIVDLDNDGKPDIATANNANSPSSTITVLRNINSSPGSIQFAAAQSFPATEMPFSIAAGDIDGDGLPDLVVTSINGPSVAVYRNTSTPGNISFAPRVEFVTGSSPYAVVIADFNSDGKPDIATANYTSGSVSVFTNLSTTGTINLSAKTDVTVNMGPRSVTSTDFDGDGKPDLAIANALSNSVSILRNTSTGSIISWGARIDIAAGTEPFHINSSDIDGDGKNEILVTNNGNHNISIYRNTSAGGITFATPVSYGVNVSFSQGAKHIAIGNLDGDGKPDVVVGGSGSMVTYFRNVSTPGTINLTRFSTSIVSNAFATGIADLDADNKPDVVATNVASNKVLILRNRLSEPMVFSFSPTSGGVGTTVFISGQKLNTVTSVLFGNVPATSFTASATNITALVGNGASGSVTVVSPFGSSSKPGFTFTSPPVPTSFSPTTGGAGTIVTINGMYFTGTTAVTFGGLPATSFMVNSDTQITAIIGNGNSGNIAITNPYGTTTIGSFTFIPPPVISGFTPGNGGTGTTITVTGNHFSNTSQVLIGNVPAASFNVLSSTTITATVGEGGSGIITIQTPGGTASSTNIFTFPRVTLTSLSQYSGSGGALITVTGTNFRPTPSGNHVFFGAAKANVVSATTSTLVVSAPAEATYDPVNVIVNGNVAYAPAHFRPQYYGMGSTTFTKVATLNSNYLPGGMILKDISGDGKPDIITTNGDGACSGCIAPGIRVLRNMSTNGNFSFAPSQNLLFVTNLRSLVVEDIDLDGKPDLIYSTSDGIFYSLNQTNSNNFSFATPVYIPGTDPDWAWQQWNIRVNDMDKDGKNDIVAFNSEEVRIIRGGVTGLTFTAHPIITLTTSGPLQIGDINNDGRPDIVLGDNPTTVYQNNSTPGNFSFPLVATINNWPDVAFGLGLGDIDNDGKLDLIGSHYHGNKILVYKNTSTTSISFGSKLTFPTAPYPGSFVYSDVNGDGKLDIVIATEKHATLLSNTSTSSVVSFAAPVNFSPGLTFNWTGFAIAGDLNGDSRPEIIASNSSDNAVTIFQNNSPLPVIIKDLVVNCTEGKVYLQWESVTETNFDRFVIQGSEDARAWTTLASVNGGAASGHYQQSLQSGNVKYIRLQMIDKDGSHSYSEVLRINCQTPGLTMQVYPIPTTGLLNLQFESNRVQSVSIRITDVSGKMLITQQLKTTAGFNNYTIDIGTLNPGLYTLSIVQSGKTHRQLIVKQ